MFYRIFREDIKVLNSHFLPIRNYINFLKEHHHEFYTHYSFVIKRSKDGEYLFDSVSETPFIPYDNVTVKPGFQKSRFQQLNPEEQALLLQNLGATTEEIVEVHTRKIKQENTIELFIKKDFENVPPIELCYYYYFFLMEKIYVDNTKELHALYFDQNLNEEQLKTVLQKYQGKLIYYITSLKEYIHNNDSTGKTSMVKDMEDIYRCISECLQGVLYYMEESFFKYLDKGLNMSCYQQEKFINEYQSKSKSLMALFKLQELPHAIEIELCKPLKRILADRTYPLNYIQKDYYQKYIDLFTKLFNNTNELDHKQVYKLLIALEYNTHNIYKAMEHDLLHILDQMELPSEKQVFLYQQLYEVQSIAVTSTIKYKRNFPGLKEHLLGFIRMQLDFQQKKVELEQQHHKKVLPQGIEHADISSNGFSKRQLNITVPQLALLARLFCESGVIILKNERKQKYFQFLSKIYKSKDASVISEHSIKNSFYKVSGDTYETVEKILIRMLGQLQKLRNSNPVD